jgi:carboxypeptidase Q
MAARNLPFSHVVGVVYPCGIAHLAAVPALHAVWRGSMSFRKTQRALLAGAALTVALVLAPVSAQQALEKVDLEAIYRIKAEGFQRSKVMEITSWLTDVYGPRVTNSPGFRKAGEWAVTEMKSWGLANVKLEPFGPFGRGWSNEKFYAMATTPGGSFPLIGMSQVWTPGTNGLISGDAISAIVESPEDFAKYTGQLKGKMVLTTGPRDVLPVWNPPASRYTVDQLRELEAETDANPRAGSSGGRNYNTNRQPPAAGGGRGAAQSFTARRMQFFTEEGALALISPGRGDGGTVFVQGGGSREASAPPGLPTISIAAEHYGRMYRTLEKKMPVRIELDIRNVFHDDPLSFNVIAEIPGTDKAGEVVMLGAHFDSWQSGTGATDNAAGSAVMMEALRILKQSGLPLRRTVRLALWGGEEQGLLGSRAYVTDHFASRADMVLKPEHARISCYFNVDNGTGAIRGVYLQGNEAVAPIFEAWMKPFNNIGMSTLTIRDTGGTDHQSFDAVGLPAFQFIQDPLEYGTRTHHSNMDVYERVQEEDMRKNAVIVAAFVYHAANRAEKLPRKPLPASPGEGRGTTTAVR